MGRIERILSKVDSFNETGRFEEAIKELKKAMDTPQVTGLLAV